MFKHSDAVHCLANFEAEDPFLIALAKCNNDQVFDECLAEWTKWVKKKEPHNLKYLGVTLKNSKSLNLLHIIAMNSSIIQFKSLLNNCKHLNSSTDYTSEDIFNLLNQSLSKKQAYKTPLFLSYPSVELADLFVTYGANPKKISFLHCYFSYRRSMQSESQQIFFKFVHNLVMKHKMNVNETDIHGRNCIALVYSDLRDKPSSVYSAKPINYYELHFLTSIGANLNLKCMDTINIGRTILLDSAYKGRVDLFSYLLITGADLELKCAKEYTLEDYIRMDYEEVLSNN